MNKYKLMLIAAVCGLGVAANAGLSVTHYYTAYHTNALINITNDLVGTANGVIHSNIAGSCYIDVDKSLYTLQEYGRLDTNNVAANGMQLPSEVTDIAGAFSVSWWMQIESNGNGANTTTWCATPNWDAQGAYVLGVPASYSPSPHGYPARVEVAVSNTYQAVVNKTVGTTGGDYLDDGSLHMCLFTYDGAGTMRFFKDGQLQDEQSVPLFNLNTYTNFTVSGGAPWPDPSNPGNIYAFGIYDEAITVGEAISLYLLGVDATVDEIQNLQPGFEISADPTGDVFTHDPVITGTVIDGAFTAQSIVLYISGNPVATNSAPSGGSNDVIFAASGLASGTYTGRVDVVSVASTPNVAQQYDFTFNVAPFTTVYQYPEMGSNGWNSITGTGKVTAVAVDGASEVSAMTLYIDGIDTGASPTYDGTGTTGTISFAFSSGVGHGAHTSTVVVAGSPDGLVSNSITWWVVLEQNAPTSMIHHWTFDEGAGTTVTDVVGGANGTIIGTNYEWKVPGVNIGAADDGGLHLLGFGDSSMWNPTNLPHGTGVLVGAYVDLPNGIITALPNGPITFEVTYYQNNSWWWSRLWDFGNSADGEDYSTGNAGPFTFATVHHRWNANAFVELGDGAGAGHTMDDFNHDAWNLDGTIVHLVWVYDTTPGSTMAKLYINGELADIKADDKVASYNFSNFAGNDVNNWLGRSNWPDQMLDCEFKDFRIMSGIMTADQVRARFNEVSPFIATKIPAIQSITVAGGMATLVWDSEAEATYYVLTKSALSDATWQTNVVGAVPSAGDSTTTTSVTASATAEFYKIEGRP